MDEDLVKKLREEATFVQSEKKHILDLYRQVILAKLNVIDSRGSQKTNFLHRLRDEIY